MNINIHPHAIQRSTERGASLPEIFITVECGEQFPAKYSRAGFRKNFLFNAQWNNKYYATKQIEVYCVKENNDWLVLTVFVKYF